MRKDTITRIKNTLKFYLSMNSLKDVPRTGWLDWNVKREHIESVPDHVYGTIQLAYAIWSEFEVPVNIDRVIAMLAFHETEETIFGDMPLVHELKQYKSTMGKIAVDSLTAKMTQKDYIRSLITEFEEKKTPEAKFAKYIDKLECDIQSKIYDEENTVDLNHQENNPSAHVPLVVKLLSEGRSFSEMWMEFGRDVYHYPCEFEDISKYAEKNNLHDLKNDHIGKIKSRVKAYVAAAKNRGNTNG